MTQSTPTPSSTPIAEPKITHRAGSLRDHITGRIMDDTALTALIEGLAIPPQPFDRAVPVSWIATLYFDTVTPQSASRSLRKEITAYPTLYRALILSGWERRKHYFTPRQTAILFHYLGAVSAP